MEELIMDDILKQILEELKALKEGQEELRLSQDRIEKKLEAVYEHTAKIAKDITETNMKIDEILDDLEYLKYKEHKTDEDSFKLKKNLKIIK